MRNARLVLAAGGLVCLAASPSRADNPIVQTNYTADPAAMVYNGTTYVYTGHDEDVTVNNFFTMNNWMVYSSTDMVNWTDHGSPMSYKTFSWATGSAWAAQPIFRNGKFYYYAPVQTATSNSVIGVAVSSSPIGPFTDAIGKPLISSNCGDIDPTVFIDDDGQAYLYWGNPNSCYVKLNQDMISYSGSVNHVPMTTASFGTRTVAKANYPTLYEEGPWFYKRNGIYYLAYASDCCSPEKIDYATSSAATGPWTYRGRIFTSAGSASFTNQTGIFDFMGHSYALYHNGALPGGSGYHRSVGIEEFKYNTDGTIPTITPTTLGPAPLANLDPFVQTEAETMAFSSGLKTEVCSEGGMDVTSINNGDYIKIRSVDFSTGATSFDVRVASSASGGSIEVHLDGLTGTSIGTCAVSGTGGAQTWATKSCTVASTTGVHDLFLKFIGSGSGNLFNFNWWRFGGPGAASVDGGGASGAGGTTGAGGASGAAGGRGGAGGGAGTPGTGGVAAGGHGGARGGNGGTMVAATGGSTGTGGGPSQTGGAPGTGGAVATGGVAGGGSGTSGNSGGQGGTATAEGGAATGCSCQTGRGGRDGFGIVSLLLAAIGLRSRRARGPARSR